MVTHYPSYGADIVFLRWWRWSSSYAIFVKMILLLYGTGEVDEIRSRTGVIGPAVRSGISPAGNRRRRRDNRRIFRLTRARPWPAPELKPSVKRNHLSNYLIPFKMFLQNEV